MYTHTYMHTCDDNNKRKDGYFENMEGKEGERRGRADVDEVLMY